MFLRCTFFLCSCGAFLNSWATYTCWIVLSLFLTQVGSVSIKNTKNILIKNVGDASLGAICWWLFGYGVAFGKSGSEWDRGFSILESLFGGLAWNLSWPQPPFSAAFGLELFQVLVRTIIRYTYGGAVCHNSTRTKVVGLGDGLFLV